MVSFDFSKAFDKVPHSLLIFKLSKLGFNLQTVKWIEQWLQGRSSKVKVNGQISNSFANTSGVPQGSVLGPLLFILYINDIPEKIAHSDCRLYADDTLLCANLSDNNSQLLQGDVEVLLDWSRKWAMPFNVPKCAHMQIGKKDPDFNIYMDGKCIPVRNELKYLGLNFDKNLKWKGHITKIAKKSNKILGLLKRCLDGAPSKVKLVAFNSVVRPCMEYASPVWSPHVKLLKDELDKVHRKAIRWIFKLPKIVSISNVMEKEKIVSLEARRSETDLNFLRKIEFGLYDINLEKYITHNKNHNTRGKVVNDQYNTDQFKYSFFNRMNGKVKVFFEDKIPQENKEK